MSPNNFSKQFFNKFIRDFGFKKIRGEHRQVFELGSKRYMFSVSSSPRINECRQLYEDCDGFVSYNLTTEKFYRVEVADPTIFTYSRTLRDGTHAYSVKTNICESEEFTCPG